VNTTNHQSPITRTIVIGDIHGCHDELLDLLAEVNFTATDRAVAVGDLIVKGPKSKEVLDLFISDHRFSSVLGNHDLAVLNFLQGRDFKYSKAQKEASRDLQSDRKRYADFLSSLPLTIDLSSHLVVHAGVRPGVAPDRQETDDLLELRTLGKHRTSRKGTPWYSIYDGEKRILFGHWPSQQPRYGPHALGLDTGCVYGHRLSAYIVETGQLVSVPARHSYTRSLRFYLLATDRSMRIDQTPGSSPSTKSIHP